MNHILVIDDNTSVREMIQRLLKRNGYDVTTAQDGREGLRVFDLHLFELVIVDLIMPEVDGIETIIQLSGKHPGVKIIAISGGGRISPHEYLELAGVLGAVRTLAKPFKKDVLLDTVRELLNQER